MHSLIHEALAQARADELARRAGRAATRREMTSPPSPRPQPVEGHAYSLPHVVEEPLPIGSDTFDPSVW